MRKTDLEKKLSDIRGWDATKQQARKLKTYARSLGYIEDVTGDACIGDVVLFARSKFIGSWKNPTFDGVEILTGEITKDSYGEAKQQHTFTIKLFTGKTMRIKGRNLYSIATFAKSRNSRQRDKVLVDKHNRGSQAREIREARKMETEF
jgi:hypothetical protein